jgi:peroxiredoxin
MVECKKQITMTHRLIILTACIGITFSTQAQRNKYSLDECARAYYNESDKATPEQKEAALRTCIIGKQFPAFSATTIAGKKYSDADMKGKVVFVTSWFATCPGCVAEMPLLNELHRKYKDKQFLLLSFSADNLERIDKFLKTNPINYEIFPDSESMIVHSMQTSYGFPTNIIVGKNGEIVEFRTGTPTDAEGLEAAKHDFISIIERELSK